MSAGLLDRAIKSVIREICLHPTFGIDHSYTEQPILAPRSPIVIKERPSFLNNVYYRRGDTFPTGPTEYVPVVLVSMDWKQAYYNGKYHLPLYKTRKDHEKMPVWCDDPEEFLRDKVSLCQGFINEDWQRTLVFTDIVPMITKTRYRQTVKAFGRLKNCMFPEEWKEILESKN